MLSRVAESLYWTARYIERAEDVTRLLDVNFHSLLDAQVDDRGEAWQRIVALLGDRSLYEEHHDDYTARSVADWVLWHEDNPNAVAQCVLLARENARSVRDQLSSEMWASVNGLFLLVRGASRSSVSREPHRFFEALRNGCHLVQGTADATMTHGEPYEFIQLGLHLERAEKTVRVVAARYPVAAALPEDEHARAHELAALLRSCSAFDAYVRRHGTRIELVPVAQELIRSRDLPRSAFHCLSICLGAVERIEAGSGRAPHRILGRLCAEIEYGEVDDASGQAVSRTLEALLAGIHTAGEAITKTYFSSRALPPTALVAQEAQQQ